MRGKRTEGMTVHKDALRPWAVVLAGGRSSRMGVDKALLPVGNRPLIVHLTEQVRALGWPCVIVLPPGGPPARVGRYQSLVPWASFVFDAEAGRGPVMGIASGASAVRSEWMMLLSCDIPNLDTALLGEMMEIANTDSPDAPLVGVYVAGEPFHGLYRREPALRAARKVLTKAGPRASARAWLDALGPARVLPATRRSWVNLNTPKDYEEYVRRSGAQNP